MLNFLMETVGNPELLAYGLVMMKPVIGEKQFDKL